VWTYAELQSYMANCTALDGMTEMRKSRMQKTLKNAGVKD